MLLSRGRGAWVTIDLVLSIISFIICSWFTPYFKLFEINREIALSSVFFSISLSLVALGIGFYERENRFAFRTFLRLGTVSWIAAILISMTTIQLIWFELVGRYLILMGSFGSAFTIILFRALVSRWLSQYPYRFLVVGNPTPVSAELDQFCKMINSAPNYDRIRALKSQLIEAPDSSTEQIINAITQAGITDIVLTAGAKADVKYVDTAITALRNGIRVVDEVTFYSEVFGKLPVDGISETWLLSEFETRRFVTGALKRTFDLFLGIIGLAISFPLLALIWVLIKISSPGPALFIQERQGRYCRPFKIYKFRTMTWQPEGDFPPSTRVNDPRVTWIGKILRPLHFDELPQIFNILMGDMSFVGPRPEVLTFARKITEQLPIYEFRYLIRPGLTGLAQIQVGYTLDNVEETKRKLAYDLYYVKSYSIALDLLIILRTVFVLTRKSR